MTFDLSSELDRERLAARMDTLLRNQSVIELTEKTIRTRTQNSYLHLLLGVVAMDTGNTLDYCKEWYFKRLCNRDLFIVTKTDRFAGNVEVIRSTRDLTKEEMSMAIDRFKRWGAENGIYMPNPGDEQLLREIAIEMGRNKQFIGG